LKKRILITGITGFVGSHLADYLIENVDKIDIYGTRRYHLSRYDHISHLSSRIKFYDRDLIDPIAVNEMIKDIKPDVIFHMAAQSFVSPSWLHPSLFMDANYKITVNLMDACIKNKINPRIHIPGSGEEYGEIHKSELPIDENTILRPVNPYSVSKIAQDYIAYVYYRSYGLNVIRTRAFNHEGARRDKVFGLPMYAYQLAKIENQLIKPTINVGVLSDKRNFTHVKDMVRAYWLAVQKCKPGELYIIGTNQKNLLYTYNELLKMLISKSTYKNKIKIYRDPKLIRPVQVPRLICNPSKFKKLTGWSPTFSIDDIVEDTLNYWRKKVENGTY